MNYFNKNDIQVQSNGNIIFIDGMTCNHCVDSVTKTLNKLNGVTVKNIDLNSGRIDFIDNEADIDEIHKNIKDLGYEIEHN